MPNRCVVYGCSNEPNLEKGIVLHCIPFADDERQEARKRRKKWIDFVQRKRLKWIPATTSSICSQHFKEEISKEIFCPCFGRKKHEIYASIEKRRNRSQCVSICLLVLVDKARRDGKRYSP